VAGSGFQGKKTAGFVQNVKLHIGMFRKETVNENSFYQK
jgi:hypothetical protein